MTGPMHGLRVFDLTRIPLGRYSRVDEIAKTNAFLLSEGTGYIIGQNIRVDGGISRSVQRRQPA